MMSIEEVRVQALNLAIKHAESWDKPEEIVKRAKAFEDYIRSSPMSASKA